MAARDAGEALADDPGVPPETLGDASRIQDAAIALAGRSVVGWKVGRINPPREGANRLAGPIFADQVTHVDGRRCP